MYRVKKGCDNLVITATLQGQRLTKVKLGSISQAQINELGERFNYPNVELIKSVETTVTDEPKERKKKPAKPTDTAE